MGRFIVGFVVSAILFGALFGSIPSHSQQPITIAVVGEMPRGPGWIDSKVLCDSRGNEFLMVKSDGQVGLASIPGGCK